MVKKDKLSISSFNVKGFKYRNYDYLRKLFSHNDILFLQEVWLHDFEFHLIGDILKGSQYHSVSAMDSTDITRAGRPYGGCAIIWKNSLPFNIKVIENNCNRICAITITYDDNNYLLISVYMPVNDNSLDSYNCFGDVLCEISTLLQIYNDYHIIIAGDFNFDFKNNSNFKVLFTQFLDHENLNCLTVNFNHYINFTYESPVGYRSFIDHIIVSDQLLTLVSGYDIDVDGLNLSDHYPLKCNFQMPLNKFNNGNIKSEVRWIDDWSVINDEHINYYKYILDILLDNIDIDNEAFTCLNYKCDRHNTIIMKTLHDIINVISFASECTIPKKKINSKPGMAGWNYYVKPFKDKSIFWSEMWKQAGCPQTGYISDIRKNTRAKYHSAIKYIKRNKDIFVKNKIANCLSNNKFSSFWQEIRKIKKPNSYMNVNVIDGCIGDMKIVDNFKDIYESLYNSVVDKNKDLIDNKINSLVEKCINKSCSSPHSFSLKQIINAISSLKSNQKDYTYNILSNNFINGSVKLFNFLNKIFNSILIHGCTDYIFNQSITVPIVKNKRKSKNDSSNYRAITLGSIICKIFEYLILDLSKDILESDRYQFAFKNEHSTTLCTSMVLQTIEYYKNNNSNVYVLFLDCTKAFDKVNHSKLFNILIDKNICPLVLRIIKNMYCYANSRIKWNDVTSDVFYIGNGVKQGGVLSPRLFNLYLDPLLNEIRKSRFGCHVGNVSANCFAYADDVALLSPSLHGINELIRICEKYSIDFSIVFNPAKCALMYFNSEVKNKFDNFNVDVFMFGQRIPLTDTFNHLGHTISNSRNLLNIEGILRDMKNKTNAIFNCFNHLDFNSRRVLFNSQCLSLYGSELFDINCSYINQICTAWRSCCRKVAKIPNRTHSNYIHTLFGTNSLYDIIVKRVLNFLLQGIFHKNDIIKSIFRSSIFCCNSYLSRNFNTIKKYLNINSNCLLTNKKFKVKSSECIEKWKLNIIQELLNGIDGYGCIEIDRIILVETLNYLCIY